MTDAIKQPQIDMDGVARRLEAIRKVSGLNKENFALLMGLDPSSYTKVAANKKPLKAEHAFAVSERWGVSMDFIYRGNLATMDPDLRAQIIAALNNPDA